MAFTLQDRLNHRAGVFAVSPKKPKPSALDRVHELMRADHNLSRMNAEKLARDELANRRLASGNDDNNDQDGKTEWGTPLRSRSIPGSAFYPPKNEKVSTEKERIRARLQ